MLLTDKYSDKIYGTITCYDRMIIQDYIPGWSHAEGMASYLKANNIRIFDFSNFSQPFTEQVRANAQHFRVPTWAPFRLQFYMNGHNLPTHKLHKKEIAYRLLPPSDSALYGKWQIRRGGRL